MKIGVVTDSSTGFSLEEMKKYPELTVVPLIIIDSKSEKYYEDNNKEIDSDLIFHKMITEHLHLTTSQTNRAVLDQYWEKALTKYDKILFLPIADNASGQYKSAMVLQAEDKFKDKVYVLETGAAIISLKYMSLIALKLAKAGKSMDDILKALTEFRKNYECFIVPNDLKFLSRGGRLPKGKALIGNILKFKPILKCKEQIIMTKPVRTLSGAMDKILETIISIKNATKETIYIIDGWCDKKILDIATNKVKQLGFTKYKIEPLCNILKTHTGNNTIGFALLPNQWITEV